MSKEYVLVKASVCWADEFDCEILAVYESGNWEQIKADTKDRLEKWTAKQLASPAKDRYGRRNNEINIGFGTNEWIGVSNYKEWVSEFKETKITEDEAKLISKLIRPSYQKEIEFTFGTGDSYFTSILELIDENGERY
jgi:hypothetical protein